MVLDKSLDESKIIAATLHDVNTLCGDVFNNAALRLTLNKVNKRVAMEGVGFLTKTLPRLGRALDKALTGTPLNSIDCGFKTMTGSKLPRFLGELFSLVLDQNGVILPNPCTTSVKVLRQILFAFAKYELPYTDEQEQQVLEKFERTDRGLSEFNDRFYNLYKNTVDDPMFTYTRRHKTAVGNDIVREARILLAKLFASFDPKDVIPRHGPGAVATKQEPWDKFQWVNVSAKITSVYPLDEYFYASLGHICDRYNSFSELCEEDFPARVVLVPKDSRGPRLISCEPVDYQWVQQGLGRGIVKHVEQHDLTRYNVFFTDQSPNQRGALLGSIAGRYATLDLSEASDRVSTGLVRLLFPDHVYTCLMACRSSSTELPNGKVIRFEKFAPMGSCLCFPIMALTIWAILTAGAPNADTRDSVLVYGDDVIVPTAHAANAIEQLESFGLKVSHDKSCISGLFRESCGTDAFKGVDVTPVRLRTVWSSKPTPESYTSWIAYANSFYDKKYFHVYDYIVEALHHVYGAIPAKDMLLNTRHSLAEVSEERRPKRRRSNKDYQSLQYWVWDVTAPKVNRRLDGWAMLLRYFTEKCSLMTNRERAERLKLNESVTVRSALDLREEALLSAPIPQSVGQYTRRGTSILVKRWR